MSGNGPSYYISNGVVYLVGAVLNTGSGAVAVLPPAARPTHTFYLTVTIGEDSTAVPQNQSERFDVHLRRPAQRQQIVR